MKTKTVCLFIVFRPKEVSRWRSVSSDQNVSRGAALRWRFSTVSSSSFRPQWGAKAWQEISLAPGRQTSRPCIVNNSNCQATSLTPARIIHTFFPYMPAFTSPLSPAHTSSSPSSPSSPSLSCLDPSLFYVPRERAARLSVYVFTMSEPQGRQHTRLPPVH